MRIAVVSDTHLPRFGRSLPPAFVTGLEAYRPDLILHCGDFTSLLAVELLERIAPVDGVAGNNDGPELVERFDRRRLLTLDGVTIGLTHGDLGHGRSTPERAIASFATEAPAVVLFGHSHIPYLERRGGALFLNPGSPTDRRHQPRFTFATLTLTGGIPDAQLVAFD